MTTVLRATALLGLFVFTGCATSTSSPVSTSGQVKRLIACRQKPGVDPANVVRLANDFSKVPGVIDVTAGRSQISDTRVATTMPPDAITFILTFRDTASADRAGNDPTYRHVCDDLLAAVSDYRNGATDVVLQNYLVSEQFTEETTTATRERRAAVIKQQNELRSQTR